MQEEYFNRFLDDLEDVAEKVRTGELTKEGLLSYGGVGAGATAPKWLLSAVEIMAKQGKEGATRGK